MLTDPDKLTIKTIVESIFEEKIDRVENKIDQVLKIVTDTQQELTLTQAKVTQHSKRLKKIEHKLNIPSPSSSALAFA